MSNILVTGGNGQLGSCLHKIAANYPSFRFFFTDVDTLDICDSNKVVSFCTSNRIRYIINCAAYTAVDKAEDEEKTAYRINRDAVENLGHAAVAVGANVIHVSTDYVFDGIGYMPYREHDKTHPVSVYGKSKLAGEEILQQICPSSVIIRTSWLYSEFGNNFLKTMLRLGEEKESLQVIFDQVGTPTYAGDLAATIIRIILSAEEGRFVTGIYHFSNEGVCSWYDFARKIMQLGRRNCNVLPIETEDYPTRAVRPHYSVLNKTKIKADYPVTIPHWEESLDVCLKNFLL